MTESEREERRVREALEEVISIMLNLNRSMGIRVYLPMQRESADPLEVEKARNSSRDGKGTEWMELKGNDMQDWVEKWRWPQWCKGILIKIESNLESK